MTRVLWDEVPPDVKTDLALRGAAREGAHAIVDVRPGERWYFRRTRYGWNHLSTDRAAKAAPADDLTPEQKAERKANEPLLQRTEEALRRLEEVLEQKKVEGATANNTRVVRHAYTSETSLGKVPKRWSRIFPISLSKPETLISIRHIEAQQECIYGFEPGTGLLLTGAILEVQSNQIVLRRSNNDVVLTIATATPATMIRLSFASGLNIQINV
jgi:hypothetical protein